MKNSNNYYNDIKKSKKSKDKRIDIVKIDNNCTCLIYYDNGEIKKSKMFYFPIMGTTKERKQVDRTISKEYQLWLKTLWFEGYLEEDDIQFIIQRKSLTNENKAV